MAYTPTEWQVGDTITAEKLNNMEQGIEDAFVAPEVAAADQGKVLTVDSSGEWAAAYNKDVLMLQGGADFDPSTGALSNISVDGDVTESLSYNVAELVLHLRVQNVLVGTAIMRMRQLAYTGGSSSNIQYYIFNSILSFQDSLLYGQVQYAPGTSSWNGRAVPIATTT